MYFFKKTIDHALGVYFGKVLYYLMIFLYIFFVIRFFFISPGVVNGPSMEPTYIDNDTFFVNKYVYLFRPPRRYDVVQLLDTVNQKMMIKRIVGLPGEIIVVKRGKIFIKKNVASPEVELDETKYLPPDRYTVVRGQQGAAKFIIGDSQYFVVGDNRSNSVDSRDYGPVDRSRITGKIIRSSADLFF